MAEASDALALAAPQHVDHVHRAEALASALHAREGLLRRFGGVPRLHRAQAVVAGAAPVGRRLAEVRQQRAASAGREFAVAQQRVQLAHFQSLARVPGVRILDHVPEHDHVLQAVGHPGVGRVAVPSRPSGLLVVRLDALGKVQMGHEAHVGLVDSHPEGDRRDHDHAFLAEEAVLVRLALPLAEARVVGERVDAGVPEPLGGAVHSLSREAVHDPGLSLVALPEEGVELLARIVLRDHGVADVGAVEAADEDGRAPQSQPVHDLAAGGLVGGSREGDPGNAGEALAEGREAKVLGTEVVSPLGDAVGLVNGEERQGNVGEQLEGPVSEEAFGRDVEEVQATCGQCGLDFPHLVVGQARVQAGRSDAGLPEGFDLVAHERDEGRDDDAGPVADDRGDLVAERLAAARGHED